MERINIIDPYKLSNRPIMVYLFFSMDSLPFKNLAQLHEMLRDETLLIDFLQKFSIIANFKQCETCCQPMSLQKRKTSSIGRTWGCRKCRSYKSPLGGSIFSGCRTPVHKLILIIWFWCCDASIQFVQQNVEVSKNTVIFWFSKIREIIGGSMERIQQIPIGGPGKIVEIDETVISKKRKYNVGRVIAQQWYFGGVERGTNKWFGQLVPNRTRSTLLPIMQQMIKPGTTIISDRWSAYVSRGFSLESVPGKNWNHSTVNHSTNFVDPESGAHTQTIEGRWGHIKKKFKMMNGCRKDHLSEYTEVEIWKSRVLLSVETQRISTEKSYIYFVALLKSISRQFPVNDTQ